MLKEVDTSLNNLGLGIIDCKAKLVLIGPEYNTETLIPESLNSSLNH